MTTAFEPPPGMEPVSLGEAERLYRRGLDLARDGQALPLGLSLPEYWVMRMGWLRGQRELRS